jgi:hypothetical protein
VSTRKRLDAIRQSRLAEMEGADQYVSVAQGELSRLREMVDGLRGRMQAAADMRSQALNMEKEAAEVNR